MAQTTTMTKANIQILSLGISHQSIVGLFSSSSRVHPDAVSDQVPGVEVVRPTEGVDRTPEAEAEFRDGRDRDHRHHRRKLPVVVKYQSIFKYQSIMATTRDYNHQGFFLLSLIKNYCAIDRLSFCCRFSLSQVREVKGS